MESVSFGLFGIFEADVSELDSSVCDVVFGIFGVLSVLSSSRTSATLSAELVAMEIITMTMDSIMSEESICAANAIRLESAAELSSVSPERTIMEDPKMQMSVIAVQMLNCMSGVLRAMIFRRA